MSGGTDPGELLSAYLDGELEADEVADVERMIAEDPAVADELDGLAKVRGALRDLPLVAVPTAGGAAVLRPRGWPLDDGDRTEPGPTAVVHDLSSHRAPAGRRLSRPVLAGAVAVAAALVAVGLVVVRGDGGGEDPFVPPVTEFASRHDAMADLVASGATEVPPMPGGFEALDPAEMGDDAPAELPSGFERMAGFAGPDGTMHVIYTHDDMAVSVYRQQGAVDWAGLPESGTPMEMEGAPAWLHTAETPRGVEEIMVLQDGDTVYTFVAAVPHDAMVSVVEDVAFS